MTDTELLNIVDDRLFKAYTLVVRSELKVIGDINMTNTIARDKIAVKKCINRKPYHIPYVQRVLRYPSPIL